MPAVAPVANTSEIAVRGHWGWPASLIVSILLTGLFMLPILPVMPVANLDSSWGYGVNEILARGLVFGRDFIFTFGPLGSVYTEMYHPEVAGIMLWGSALVAAGFCTGFLMLSMQNRSMTILALPLLVIEAQSRDAVLMAIPLLLLLCTFVLRQVARPSFAQSIGLCVIAAATGAIPLVKGSFGATSLFLLVLSVVLLTRWRNFPLAVGIVAAALLGLVGSWMLAGQPLGWLPKFFSAQSAIIAGYGDAMTLAGSPLPIAISLVLFATLVFVFHVFIGRAAGFDGLIASLGIGAFLFIAFKAAFVRQDVAIHLHIAMGTLLLAALAITMLLPARISKLLWIAPVIGWLVMEWQIGGLRPAVVLDPIRSEIRNVVHGSAIRLSGGHRLNAMFDEANSEIRKTDKLPQVTGTAEVYPSELAAIYANGLQWAGKPIPQSYSSYTPALDRVNTDFLAGSGAPRNIFYTTSQTIDNRLPATQDSGSLKIMFSSYSVVGRTGPYVQLVRKDHPHPVSETGISSITASINQRIDIPKGQGPILAKIDMKKSILGSLVSIAYKLPPINIDTIFEDGRVQRNRFIPGMAETGFIVSPFLGDEEDFIRIAANAEPKAQVKQIQISVDNPAFWRSELQVSFSELHVEPQREAAALVQR